MPKATKALISRATNNPAAKHLLCISPKQSDPGGPLKPFYPQESRKKPVHPLPSACLTDRCPVTFFRRSNTPSRKSWPFVQIENQATEVQESFNYDHPSRGRILVFGKT
jgi:hypothetical protein